MLTKQQTKLRKRLFPTPPTFTSSDCEQIIKELYALPHDKQRTVMSMILGANTARVSSPQKNYQMSARLFFTLLQEAMKDTEVHYTNITGAQSRKAWKGRGAFYLSKLNDILYVPSNIQLPTMERRLRVPL